MYPLLNAHQLAPQWSVQRFMWTLWWPICSCLVLVFFLIRCPFWTQQIQAAQVCFLFFTNLSLNIQTTHSILEFWRPSTSGEGWGMLRIGPLHLEVHLVEHFCDECSILTMFLTLCAGLHQPFRIFKNWAWTWLSKNTLKLLVLLIFCN